MAYFYTGPRTRVRENSDYRIEAFVRADQLPRGRACLSASFLDHRGERMAGTLVRSKFVGGSEGGDAWVRVELYLPSAPPEAFTIGLTAWVLQQETWQRGPSTRREIVRKDVRGGAWFDDITIIALPRVELSSAAPGNVLAPEGRQELDVLLADYEDPTLVGVLSISDTEGRVVGEHRIRVLVDEEAEPAHIQVAALTPGLYRARLDVISDGMLIASRSLTFARLAPLRQRYGANARPFGIVIHPADRARPADELALLTHQAVFSAKVPVWTGLPLAPSTSVEQRATDRLLQALTKRGVALTGVMFGPPRAIMQLDGAYPRPLISLLADSPSAWQSHLAAVAVPYAGLFRWWQVGPDTLTGTPLTDELPVAVAQLRSEIHRFITMPLLALPASSAIVGGEKKWPVEQLALTLGTDVRPDWIAAHFDRYAGSGYDRVTAFVEPLAPGSYARVPRLANWAQRILSARHAGADTVFVPQTWHTTSIPAGSVTEPDETYLVFRTIADVIADAAPGQRVPMAPDVHCLAFHHGETTTLALWDASAPPEGRRHTIQLGVADRQIDLWGNITPIPRDGDGRHVLTLSAMPLLVDGVERWLIDFRTNVALTPSHVESGMELVRHELLLANPDDRRTLSGTATLEVPPSWETTPRSLDFTLSALQEIRQAVEIAYPSSEPAGDKRLAVGVRLTEAPYFLRVPLTLDLGLEGIDVVGSAVVETDALIIRHTVTNHTDQPVSFRGAANVPGRERLYRPFANVLPGRSQTVEYHFSHGTALIGKRIRLVLSELNDGPRTHNLELVVP